MLNKKIINYTDPTHAEMRNLRSGMASDGQNILKF